MSKKLSEDSALTYEALLQRFFCKLKQKNFFNEVEYDSLLPSGSAIACIYGAPKMHKSSSSDSFPKLRSIVSSISTLNYNFACFLCDLLLHLVLNDYSLKVTFSFVSQIKNASLSKNNFFLFTNILLQEFIDITINLIFHHHTNVKITKK